MIEMNFEQGSLEWHKARAGIVTGSRLERALGTEKVKQTLIWELISERMTEPQMDEIFNKNVQRGNEFEDEAIVLASRELKIRFEKIGFLMSDYIKDFGVSPDAVCRNKRGRIIGGIETKCPSSKKHLEYVMNKELPKEYQCQVYAPFLLSNRITWWIFASYDDRIYGEHKSFYFKVEREEIEDELISMKTNLIGFIERLNEEHKKLTF